MLLDLVSLHWKLKIIEY